MLQVLHILVHLCAPCACRCPQRQQRDIRPLGTGVIDSHEPLCEFQESNLSPVNEQSGLLTTKPSLQPYGVFLNIDLISMNSVLSRTNPCAAGQIPTVSEPASVFFMMTRWPTGIWNTVSTTKLNKYYTLNNAWLPKSTEHPLFGRTCWQDKWANLCVRHETKSHTQTVSTCLT